MQEAADLAQDSDVAVVFVRTVETEQQDSGIMALPRDQDTLIRAVAAANPNTVVVLGTGAPVLTPWAPSVAAIVHSYFGGQEQGSAPARVLFGDVSPSGKLPYTMARDESQYAEIGVDNPVARKLVGFAKVELNPGQSPNVTVTIDPADVTHPLSYWSSSANRWATARGTYTVSVGSASRDLRQTDTFEVR